MLQRRQEITRPRFRPPATRLQAIRLLATRLLAIRTSPRCLAVWGASSAGARMQAIRLRASPQKTLSNPAHTARYPAQANARIPLQPGTVITIAWGVKHGDVESRLTAESMDATSLTFSSKTNEYENDLDKIEKPQPSTHTVCNTDFQTAKSYATVTGPQPRIEHDLTRVRLTDKAFQEIKSTGKFNFDYWDIEQAGDDNLKPEHDAGVLTRVEPQDVPYPMIVNDERVTLPAIHLAGITASVGKDPRPKKNRPTHTESEVYVIDDPLDPMVLLLRMKDPIYHDSKFRIENVKIDFVVPHPVNLVEKQACRNQEGCDLGHLLRFQQRHHQAGVCAGAERNRAGDDQQP